MFSICLHLTEFKLKGSNEKEPLFARPRGRPEFDSKPVFYPTPAIGTGSKIMHEAF